MLRAFIVFTLFVFMGFVGQVAMADVLLDTFDNDTAATNGTGTDCHWNPPFEGTFHVSTETSKTYSGGGALKVTWENKDLWPGFVIANLNKLGNDPSKFIDADSIRMAIAGPAGRIIMKLTDIHGTTTADLSSVTTSGSDEYQLYEFPYYEFVINSDLDIENIAEILLLVDAGVSGTSGTIYIDDIELILGSGEFAETVYTIDNFDNDNSIDDDPNAQDSTPSSGTLLGGPFQTTVMPDPATGESDFALQVDYKTSPWSVLWVEELDITDWTPYYELTIDVYGTAGGLLLKLKHENGREQEPDGGLQDHYGDQWDTLRWDLSVVDPDILANMGKLIVFVEGPSGGEGTIYFDNLALRDGTDVGDWALH